MVRNLYHRSDIYTGNAIIQTVLSFVLVDLVCCDLKNILNLCSVNISSREYAKSRQLNKYSQFWKDSQYKFFLLWQKKLQQLSTGVYNLTKGMDTHSSESVKFNKLLQQTI